MAFLRYQWVLSILLCCLFLVNIGWFTGGLGSHLEDGWLVGEWFARDLPSSMVPTHDDVWRPPLLTGGHVFFSGQWTAELLAASTGWSILIHCFGCSRCSPGPVATTSISITGGNSKVMVVAKLWSDYIALPTQARWRRWRDDEIWRDGDWKGW